MTEGQYFQFSVNFFMVEQNYWFGALEPGSSRFVESHKDAVNV